MNEVKKDEGDTLVLANMSEMCYKINKEGRIFLNASPLQNLTLSDEGDYFCKQPGQDWTGLRLKLQCKF